MKNKKKIKFKLYLNVLFTIFIAILFITLINLSFNGYKQNSNLIVNYDLSKDIIPNPIQNNIKPETFDEKVRGITLNIKKLAEYDITGKVEAIEEYSTNLISSILSRRGKDPFSYISPIDLALSWGELARSDNSSHFFANPYYLNESRVVYFSADRYLMEKYGNDYIVSHFSNNHIVTLDSNFRKMLSKVKIGDIVRIKGYLVYITYVNKDKSFGAWGPSSLTRTDTGNHSCEILYVEDMVIMPKNYLKK